MTLQDLPPGVLAHRLILERARLLLVCDAHGIAVADVDLADLAHDARGRLLHEATRTLCRDLIIPEGAA